MVVYKLSDRIPVKIGAVTFWVSPLSWGDKSRLLTLYKQSGGTEISDPMKIAVETLRSSLKSVDGIEYADGSMFQVELDESGNASEESISELLQIDGIDKLVTVCSSFAMKEIKSLQLEGVEIDLSQVRSVKKKPVVQSVAS